MGSSPATQAGLVLDATGLVSYDNYSIAMTFEFLDLSAFGGGWRRIVDTQNRQSDNGFYVDPDNFLQVYPVVTGSTTFTTPGFDSVVLSNFVNGKTRELKAYLNGVLELESDTDQLNLDNANNLGHLQYFFSRQPGWPRAAGMCRRPDRLAHDLRWHSGGLRSGADHVRVGALRAGPRRRRSKASHGGARAVNAG